MSENGKTRLEDVRPVDTGLSEFARLRKRMVQQQLLGRGICDQQVLDAMATVPREEFVPVHLRHAAYNDGALPIAHNQTISQPYTVAFMCEAAQLTGDEKILEIGTGSGYGSAVLSRIGRQVWTIERIKELAVGARETLARVGYDNVKVHVGDGSLGLPESAPFDAIIVTAGAERLPKQYLEQLADGGRLIIPIGEVPYSQTMHRVTRHGSRFDDESIGSFMFVPLIGAGGWREDAM